MSSNLCRFERLEKPLQKVAQKQQLQKKVILKPSKKEISQTSFENHQLRKEECSHLRFNQILVMSQRPWKILNLPKRFMTITWQHLIFRDVKTFQKSRTEPALIEK